jgi:hypothetical protein
MWRRQMYILLIAQAMIWPVIALFVCLLAEHWTMYMLMATIGMAGCWPVIGVLAYRCA